jgi:hypothetical protein
MMEAARTSETMVNFYQTTPHYNPEDSHLRTHRHENLKSYLVINDLPCVIHKCIIQGVSEKVGAVLGVNSPAQK